MSQCHIHCRGNRYRCRHHHRRHVLHGANDIIGATGWMALQPPYREEYDACGCFKYYASGNGIGARVRDARRANKAYKGKLRQKPICRISAYDVFSAYNDEDPIAISVLHKAVEMWGMASANLVSLLNPQKDNLGLEASSALPVSL